MRELVLEEEIASLTVRATALLQLFLLMIFTTAFYYRQQQGDDDSTRAR